MTQRELDAAAKAVRRYVDATAYGGWISDAVCRDVAQFALQAAEDARGPVRPQPKV